MSEARLLGRVLLELGDEGGEIREDLSAIANGGGHLWVTSDERPSLERLSPLEGRGFGPTFGERRSFLARELVDLRRESGEIDLEAVDLEGDFLWFAGSHSAKRKKPKGKKETSDLERLATVVEEPSRFVLGRLEVARGELRPGGARLAIPAGGDGGSRLEGEGGEGNLLALLEGDPHLGPFLAARSPGGGFSPIPGKDNGFDIEGLCVRGSRVTLGLRGPVLRGYAVLLELELEEEAQGRLSLRPIGDDGALYRTRFLDLDGLGVRELCKDGGDLLLLAGPSMDLDGPVRLFRSCGGPEKAGRVVMQAPGVLEPVFDVPFGRGTDHAEGLCLFSWFEENDAVAVLHDSPDPGRLRGEGGILLDVFALPRPG